MAKYLVIPKENQSRRDLYSLRDSLSLVALKRSLPSAEEMMKSDPYLQSLRSTLEEYAGELIGESPRAFGHGRWASKWRSADTPKISLEVDPYPGITLAEIPDERKESFEAFHASNNYLLNADLEIPLIEPLGWGKAKPRDNLNKNDIWHLACINMQRSQNNNSVKTGKGVKIVVVDTGVEVSHKELKGRINKTFNQFIEPATKPPSHFHGTAVSSLICGENLGVAPDAEVISIASLVGPNNSTTVEELFLAMSRLSKEEITIVNISGGLSNQYRDQHINAFLRSYPNAIVIAAVGNDGPNKAYSPGSIEASVTVGAVGQGDDGKPYLWKKSGGKKLDPEWADPYSVPDLVAPGVEVTVATLGDKYVTASGTSFAAPIISGVIATIIEDLSQRFGATSVIKKNILDEFYNNKNYMDLGMPVERQGKGLFFSNSY